MKWIGFAAAAAVLLAAVLPTGAIADEQTSSLVVKSCTVCHKTERICNAIGKKDEAQWEETVSRMVAKGAPLNDEQARLVAEYLSGLTEKAPPVCP